MYVSIHVYVCICICCESATLNMPTNLENSAVATGLEKVSFHSKPKKRQYQRMLRLPHNYTHIMLVNQRSKFSKPGFSSTWTVNFQVFKLEVLEKAEEPEINQIANIHWIIEKAREFQKNIYFCFISYAKAFDCLDHNKLWKILKEMGIPDHLTCLLRNLYAGQEATVRTGHGTTGWFQIGKGVHQGYILSPCLFNFWAEYIMRNAGLDEAQAGIKIAGRNTNNLRYADDATLMAKSEELKSLLM